jgi:hypothetical protein
MDPQAFITWLQTVDNVSSNSSILVIAGILRYFVVPAVKAYFTKQLSKDLVGTATLAVCFVLSIIIMVVVGTIRKLEVEIVPVFMAALVAALTSVGIHSVEKTIKAGNPNEPAVEDVPRIEAVQVVDADPASRPVFTAGEDGIVSPYED